MVCDIAMSTLPVVSLQPHPALGISSYVPGAPHPHPRNQFGPKWTHLVVLKVGKTPNTLPDVYILVGISLWS